jgi:small subunit ribosomal protein S6
VAAVAACRYLARSHVPYSAPHQRRVAHDQREVFMMRRYETVYIFDSSLEEPAITEKLERFNQLLTKSGKGSVASTNHWGKRSLAFPIKKKETGYYVVVQFEAAGELLPEYERAVKLDDSVLRYLVVLNEGEPPKPMPTAPAVVPELLELEEEEA